jgi:hypothetical protein
MHKGADCRFPDELEGSDGLLPHIVPRLFESMDQRLNCRCPNLAQRIGSTPPDNPVIVLKAADERFDEWFPEISH